MHPVDSYRSGGGRPDAKINTWVQSRTRVRPHTAGMEMNTRRIAVTGLNESLKRTLLSMLRSISELTAARWQLADAESSSVLIAGGLASASEIEFFTQAGRPVIVIVDESSNHPGTGFELRHPFRGSQLLSVLDEADLLIQQREAQATARSIVALGPGPWSFAESLRTLPRRDARGLWYRASGAFGDTVYVRDDLLFARASAETWERMRRLDLELTALCPWPESPHVDTRAVPGFALGWLSGMRGPVSLAPWLDANATWTLRQWPDFGVVGVEPGAIELAALLGRNRLSTERLLRLSGQEAAQVNRFLNASAMAGLLLRAPDLLAVNPNAKTQTAPASAMSELFRVLQHAWVPSG